ncbi:MAG: nascent polypeptide-associated complex protein [Sulfolobaceae archaeon]|nr:nascent polypeptide-associated complex protein [Sulfolobaceae archaeon]
MGIKAEQINAIRVIIETEDKNIIIENPTVTKATVMGQEAITVIGTIKEEPKQKTVEIREEDVKFLMEQTGKSEQEVREALNKANGDVAKALMILTGANP